MTRTETYSLGKVHFHGLHKRYYSYRHIIN
nr:MAG TPA: hypothetical protein [Herelleviridae sp.]